MRTGIFLLLILFAASPLMAQKKPPTKRQPPKPAFAKVDLPSGGYLSESMVAIPQGWMTGYFPRGWATLTINYPDGTLQGVFSVKDGKLNGYSASLHENGKLAALINYKMAARHGPMRLYNEESKLTYFAEYRSGNQHGLACLFQSGRPWLVQEWELDKMRHEYLVQYKDEAPIIITNQTINAEEREDAKNVLYRLTKKLAESEQEVKSEVRQWYAEEDRRIKQDRIAKLAPKKDKARQARVKARAKVMAKVSDAQWRGALQRSFGSSTYTPPRR